MALGNKLGGKPPLDMSFDEDDLMPVCPKCSSPMAIRMRKVDGKKFLGCVMFSSAVNPCNGTRDLSSIPTDVMKKLLGKDALGSPSTLQPKGVPAPGAANAIAAAFKAKQAAANVAAPAVEKWAQPTDLAAVLGKKHAGKGRRRHYRVGVAGDDLEWMNAVLAFED